MDNIIINNKQFIYTLCSNLYNYLHTEQENEKKIYYRIISNIFHTLDNKSKIYNILEKILNNMFDYKQVIQKKHYIQDIDNSHNIDLDLYLYIDNDFTVLKDYLITEREKEQLNDIKREIEHEKECNNDYINKLQDKYTDVIISVLYDENKSVISLLDGENISIKNNDRLIII